jgi:hypothetical protein
MLDKQGKDKIPDIHRSDVPQGLKIERLLYDPRAFGHGTVQWMSGLEVQVLCFCSATN